ncbi:MAG: CoB--CoM heterodisulfide reductase iron-sulfur subunit A family protein [Archaeoglobaceae archaeon]|nr:CoB--CoM heterodisulfide reductase iron-sulfur subunit A family protein [Archaeoglobaceae archaeon]MDW7990219.1 CoB--CoM heterodisulfide reductase iron-sulfur subunit A family protein [Archaeoglobaceae archaeon]
MPKPVLVIGGGIAGIQAALDLADQGIQVYLVEKTPSIGGKMMQLDKTFPTLDCSACILTPKMVAVARHPNIKLLTYSEVIEVTGSAGNFNVKILKKPRYVDEEKCIGCGICFNKCPSKVPDEFNLGMSQRRAIYVPFPQAVPLKATIDKEHCIYFTKQRCRVCEKVCPTKAINYEQKPETIELNVASIVVATGYQLIDPTLAAQYGYGKYQNVYISLEFERLLSSTGPTGGEIVRRSDNKHPKNIAFIQCVCSRDVKINPNCSAFCCMASVKHSILAKEHLPNVDCTIFYMDLRAFGKGYQEFYNRAMREFGVKFMRGKPAKIEEEPETKNLIITYEDTFTGLKKTMTFDMVVLAVGVKPIYPEALKLPLSEDGYVQLKNQYLDPVLTMIDGVYTVGVAAGAKDIPDSVVQSGNAAIKASILAGGAQK